MTGSPVPFEAARFTGLVAQSLPEAFLHPEPRGGRHQALRALSRPRGKPRAGLGRGSGNVVLGGIRGVNGASKQSRF